jgi:hypothetical protein
MNLLFSRVATLLLLLLGTIASAQDVNIKRIELENANVFIYYDLTDTTRGRLYSVNLYSSRDNFINPLTKVSGDFGIEVLPGSDRKISINAVEEFGPSFEGKVSFELRAKVYIPFIRMEGFGKKFKRGKPYEIHWTGGRPQNVLNFDLYKGDTKVQTFANIPNAGKYNLVFPTDTRPGTYKFRISDGKNRDEIVNTTPFTISRKIPLAYKIIPVFVAGGVIYILTKPKPECEGCLPEFPVPEN